MKLKIFCLAIGALIVSGSAMAADLELEITQQTLNRLVASLGSPSAGGLFQPNALGSLGYNNCTPLGVLNCNPGSGGTGTVAQTTAGQNTGRSNVGVSAGTRVFDVGAVGQSPSSKQVPISLCQGPDGKPVISPTADPIAWQWWITEPSFVVAANELKFSATVRYRIGSAMPMSSQTISTPNLAGNARSVTSRIDTAASLAAAGAAAYKPISKANPCDRQRLLIESGID
jgi:hypothetical protein